MNNKTESFQYMLSIFFLAMLFVSTPNIIYSQVTMDNFIGANVRRGDPIDKFTPVSNIREYHDWVLDEGFVANGDSPGYPSNKYKWNAPSYSGQSPGISFDQWYGQVYGEGYTILPSMINSPPYIINSEMACGGGNYCDPLSCPNCNVSCVIPCPWELNILERKPIFQYTNSIGLPSPFNNILVNNDDTNPYSYIAHADHLYHFTARYGSKSGDDYSDEEFDNIENKLHDDELTPTLELLKEDLGQGKIRYIENFNEPDKYWHITDDEFYYQPSEFAAMLSADYDGHMGGINNTIQSPSPIGIGKPMPVGVYGADPNMKMVMAGLADLDWNYTEDILKWFDNSDGSNPSNNRLGANRVYPFHVFNYHRYSNKMYKNLLSVHGFSPEEDIFSIDGSSNPKSMKYHMIDLVSNIDNYITSNNAQNELGDREIWLTEFGYDTSPLSRQGAIPDVTLDQPIEVTNDNGAVICVLTNLRDQYSTCLLPHWKFFNTTDQALIMSIIYETQGQWLTRSLLEFSTTGFDRAFIYDIRDQDPNIYCFDSNENGYNPFNYCQYAGRFAYSGLLESNLESWAEKPSWYYVSTVKNVLSGYSFLSDSQTACDPGNSPAIATNCEMKCPRIYEYVNGQGDQIFAFWSPTSCHIDEYAYTINVPGTASTDYTIVTMQDGNPNGISEGFTGITNNQIEVMVSEYPKFLIIGQSITSCEAEPVIDLEAKALSCNTVELTWDVVDNGCTIDHYNLYFHIGDMNFDPDNATIGQLTKYPYFDALGSLPLTDAKGYISGLESGQCYYFFVSAVSEDGVESDLIYASSATFAQEELCVIEKSNMTIEGLNNNASHMNAALTLFDYDNVLCPGCDYIKDGLSYPNEWNTVLTNGSINVNSFILNLGQEYQLHSFSLNDGQGTGTFEVEYLSTAGTWMPYFTYTPTGVPNVWRYFSNMILPDIAIQKLRFTFVTPDSRINKIMICGTPISSGTVAGCVGDEEFLCNEDASFEVDVCSNNGMHTLVLNSLSGETGDWEIGNTSYSNTASITHIIPDPNFQISTVDISFTISNPCTIQCVEIIDLPQEDPINSDFSFDQTFCNPIVVFNSANSNWNHAWTYEDANGVVITSNDPNPVFNFEEIGSYTVTHIVSNDCNSSETTVVITIAPCTSDPSCNCTSDFILEGNLDGDIYFSQTPLSQLIQNFGNGQTLILDLRNICVEVNGNLIFDIENISNVSPEFIVIGGEFAMNENSSITINGGVYFVHGNNFHGCNSMWKGIIVNDFDYVNFNASNNSWLYTPGMDIPYDIYGVRLNYESIQISDAVIGIALNKPAYFSMEKVNFDKNFIGVYIKNYSQYYNPFIGYYSGLTECNFNCTDFLSLTTGNEMISFDGFNIPELNSWAYAGLVLEGVSLNIGDYIEEGGYMIPDLDLLPNTFEKLSNGIIVKNCANINIKNSTFKDMKEDSPNISGINNIGDGFGIWATGTGSEMLNINGLGVPSTVSTFEACDVGIYSRDVNLTIGDDALNIGSQHVKMVDVNTGIEIEMGGNNSINISGNNISANEKGILLNNPIQPNLNIQNNYIEVGLSNNSPNTALVGLDLQMVMGNETVDVTIVNNDIHIFGGATIDGDSHYGIRSSASNDIDIVENTITIENNGNVGENGRVGMYIRASDNILIACNSISGVATNSFTNGNSKGIWVQNTSNSDYSCNTFEQMDRGISFEMGCSNTQILANYFDVFKYGIELGDVEDELPGVFGVQERNGNTWTEDTEVAASYNVDPNNVLNSLTLNRFVIQESSVCGDGIPDYFPSCLNTIQVTYGNPLTWFTLEAGSFDECTISGNTCNYPTPFLTPGNTELDDAIINEQVFSDIYNAELNWQLQRTLFQKLNANNDLLSDANNNSFYNEKIGEAVGQLVQVNDNVNNVFELVDGVATSLQQWRDQTQTLNNEIINIDQALANSSGQDSIDLTNQKAGLLADLQGVIAYHRSAVMDIRQQQFSSISNAIAPNDVISPTHLYESNEQVVNDIWASTVALGNKDFTSNQVLQLVDIGRQCFIDGGYIPVSKARAMLLLIGLEVTDDGCDKSKIRDGNERNYNNIRKNNKFQIFPNPTRDDLELKYQFENLESSHQVFIFDITGKRLSKYSLKNQSGILQINTDKFATGMYWLSIVEDQSGKNIYSEKIIIQK